VTSVLKTAHASHQAVRPLAMPLAADPPSHARDTSPEDPELVALRARVARLEEACRERDLALAHAAEAAEQAVIAARKQGAEAAGLAFHADDEARIEALRDTLTAALERIEVGLQDLDRLAPALARDAVDALFGGMDRHDATVTAMLTRRLNGLRRDLVLAVRVSGGDFADTGDLAAIVGHRTGCGIDIVIDEALAPGQCTIDLKLGHIDLDAAAYWRALAATLDAAAEVQP